MRDHLILRFEAPLMSFGGEAIDNHGVVRDYPAASMITGLLANALGWHRTEHRKHDRLQDRLVFGARLDRRPRARIVDLQNARLREDDRGWTTRGTPEGRKKSGSYRVDQGHLRRTGEKVRVLTHQRFRQFDADAVVCVVLRLEPADEAPTLGDVEAALDRPARPLFLGRKPCLPAARIVEGHVAAADILGALEATHPLDGSASKDGPRGIWPEGEGEQARFRTFAVTDRRDWRSGVHGGSRRVCEGMIRPRATRGSER